MLLLFVVVVVFFVCLFHKQIYCISNPDEFPSSIIQILLAIAPNFNGKTGAAQLQLASKISTALKFSKHTRCRQCSIPCHTNSLRSTGMPGVQSHGRGRVVVKLVPLHKAGRVNPHCIARPSHLPCDSGAGIWVWLVWK